MKKSIHDPLIWIVIPTWNRGTDIIDCIKSIHEQTYKKYKLVIVDNGSLDDTIKLIKSNFPELDLIELKSNKGASFATNKGFDFALANNADLVLRLDSDTVLDKNYLATLTNTILNLPDAGIVSGKIFSFFNPNKIWFTGGKLTKLDLGAKYLDQGKNFNPNEKTICEVDLLPSTGMLITRDLIESLRGFDEDYLVYYEDFDFCLRALKKGVKLYYDPNATLLHKVFSQKNTSWTAFQWNKSKMIFYRKHAKNMFHKFFLILYAFMYATFRAIFTIEDRGNRGPYISTIKGLLIGLLKPLS